MRDRAIDRVMPVGDIEPADETPGASSRASPVRAGQLSPAAH
jgi:hypothetical protein